MWFVYIIKCVDCSLYTGSTNDLEGRFEKHKNGKGAKYTRSHVPEKIVFSEKCDNKIIAQRREREIKNLTREEKLKFIQLNS
ncbi:MAG: GIY-YIG nuclease family protein [Candidatus Staskawiczbacteria bacterium]|nr:GIY-YIG nuclease family protein [Candidatus Staskawiczbacteria bacterium]